MSDQGSQPANVISLRADYSTRDQDWSYCMWECGVAQLPEPGFSRLGHFLSPPLSGSRYRGAPSHVPRESS
jgi:hypothetical protein